MGSNPIPSIETSVRVKTKNIERVKNSQELVISTKKSIYEIRYLH
ncbi:MAG: hypothetical protein R2680_12115 [Nitrososphaeraceae archaeon]